MWEWAEPAETRAKTAIVSKHNMATQLMRVIFMAFTSLRNLTLSYPADGMHIPGRATFLGNRNAICGRVLHDKPATVAQHSRRTAHCDCPIAFPKRMIRSTSLPLGTVRGFPLEAFQFAVMIGDEVRYLPLLRL